MGLHAFDPTRVPSFGRQAEHPRLLDIQVTTPPATQPVSVAEMSLWLRVDGTDQDGAIIGIEFAATAWAQSYTHRRFINQGLTTVFARFPVVGADLYLPGPPVSVLTSLTYTDGAGVAQVYDVADLTIEPLYGLARVNPDAAQDWPQDAFDVTAVYTAGYGAINTDVPDQIRQAIKIAGAQMWMFRADQIAGSQFSKPGSKSSMALLNDFRVFRT